MKKHNFYAGPSILSEFTKEETAKAVMDFAGTGLSVMEVSHRSAEFQAVVDETIALVKELLEVPEGHYVLLLQGGASTQFYLAPLNLMKKKAAYLNTGSWASKAIKEAKLVGEVVEVRAGHKQGKILMVNVPVQKRQRFVLPRNGQEDIQRVNHHRVVGVLRIA